MDCRQTGNRVRERPNDLSGNQTRVPQAHGIRSTRRATEVESDFQAFVRSKVTQGHSVTKLAAIVLVIVVLT